LSKHLPADRPSADEGETPGRPASDREARRELNREVVWAGFAGEHRKYWLQYLVALAAFAALILFLVFWPK
jgi:hypothetical protein